MSDAVDEVSIQIAAPPATVWAMITDVSRMGEWSPETRRCFWVGRNRGVGARFVGINRDRFLVWPTLVRVEESTPGRVFAFRNTTGNVLWRYEFHELDGGTRLVEQRDTSRIYRRFVGATYRLMGGWDNRTHTVLAGMQQTVERVKAAAEA